MPLAVPTKSALRFVKGSGMVERDELRAVDAVPTVAEVTLLALPLVVLAAVPKHVLVQELRGLDVPRDEVTWVNEKLIEALARQRFEVVTGEQVASALGLERQRQLLGCAEGSSCSSEIALALGVDGIVSGSVAKVDGGFDLSVKIFSAQSGALLGAQSGVAADRSAVSAKWSELVAALDGLPAPPTVSSTGYAPPVWLLVSGLVVAAAGGACLAGSRVVDASLPGAGSLTELQSRANTGSTLQTLGFVGLGVGGAATVTSLVLGALLHPPAQVTLVPSASGASVFVGGHF
ncbi:MAG: hypothetical protein GQE15_16805 [Archangiaceae bacterium]|nr:hypothetical protein [Archangiaceae bacterium]